MTAASPIASRAESARTSPVETFVSRLECVRQRGAGQWSACCPAHPDNGPSLSIREVDEGRVLLHCFAGCHVDQIVAAVGLELTDLFPPRPQGGRGTSPLKRRHLLGAGQALELLAGESNLVAVAASNIAHGVALGDADRARVLQAAGRIAYLRQEMTF